jgi:hypothetical protein
MTPLQNFGVFGENEAALALRAAGLEVVVPEYRLQMGADLEIINRDGEVVPVQVKTSRFYYRRDRKRYTRVCQFRFNKLTISGGFVLAGALTYDGLVWFVIPVDVAKRRKSLFIRSDMSRYRGWAAEYYVGKNLDKSPYLVGGRAKALLV